MKLVSATHYFYHNSSLKFFKTNGTINFLTLHFFVFKRVIRINNLCYLFLSILLLFLFLLCKELWLLQYLYISINVYKYELNCLLSYFIINSRINDSLNLTKKWMYFLKNSFEYYEALLLEFDSSLKKGHWIMSLSWGSFLEHLDFVIHS